MATGCSRSKQKRRKRCLRRRFSTRYTDVWHRIKWILYIRNKSLTLREKISCRTNIPNDCTTSPFVPATTDKEDVLIHAADCQYRANYKSFRNHGIQRNLSSPSDSCGRNHNARLPQRNEELRNKFIEVSNLL